MTVFLYPFLIIAAIGLALSFAVHLASLTGLDLPSETFGLHFGVFIVWIPTILLSNSTRHGFKRHYGWKDALRGCPAWMRWMVYGLFLYAFTNIFLAVYNGFASGAMLPLRAFSGHWMAFYGAAFAVLYSTLHLTPLDADAVESPSSPIRMANRANR